MTDEQLVEIAEVAYRAEFFTAEGTMDSSHLAALRALFEVGRSAGRSDEGAVLSEVRAAHRVSAEQLDRFRDVLTQAFGLDSNPGDEALLDRIKRDYGIAGQPERTTWRDFTGSVEIDMREQGRIVDGANSAGRSDGITMSRDLLKRLADLADVAALRGRYADLPDSYGDTIGRTRGLLARTNETTTDG